MRQTIFLILLVLSYVSSCAQLRWGVEAGLNISHGFETEKTKIGYNIGALAEYSFNDIWAIESALKLTSQPFGLEKYQALQLPEESRLKKSHLTVIRNFEPYYLTLPVRACFRFRLSERVKLSVAAGPMIGVGLFGRGNVKYISYSEDNTVSTSYNKLDNIFKHDFYGHFSSTRFEYGASIRIGAEFYHHFRLCTEYSLLHVSGVEGGALDNMNIFSINIGYIF